MRIRNYAWRLLRTKDDETTDDTDWVGDVSTTDPAESITASMPPFAERHHPLTHVEICLVAVDVSGAPQDRAGTVTLELIEEIERNIADFGGTQGNDSVWVDRGSQASASLQTVYAFDIQGATNWTVRIHNDSSLPANVDLEVWYRYATRGE